MEKTFKKPLDHKLSANISRYKNFQVHSLPSLNTSTKFLSAKLEPIKNVCLDSNHTLWRWFVLFIHQMMPLLSLTIFPIIPTPLMRPSLTNPLVRLRLDRLISSAVKLTVGTFELILSWLPSEDTKLPLRESVRLLLRYTGLEVEKSSTFGLFPFQTSVPNLSKKFVISF